MSRLPPRRTQPPGGHFRRMIALRRDGDRAAWGWVEDDFHHFGVRLDHADGLITGVTAVTERAPWSTCAAAEIALGALKGQALRSRASEVGAMINMRIQCTHMFDLAGLVMVQAFHARPPRVYEVDIPDREPGIRDGRAVQLGVAAVTVRRDGHPGMSWVLEDGLIIAPQPYAGHTLDAGFRAWTEEMPEDEAEMATILRRAIMVSGGRFIDMDQAKTAEDSFLPPVCHTYSGVLSHARRIENSDRDYSARPERMLAFRDRSPKLSDDGHPSKPPASRSVP